MREKNSLYLKNDFFKKVMNVFGKHYYWATLFFPKKIRNEIFITYAFVRRLDNIVDDEQLSFFKKRKNFLIWYKNFKNVFFNNKLSEFEEINLFYQIVKEKNIDFKYIKAFIRSMFFDLKKVRIKNYKELKKYMFGSATVIGYFILYILNSFSEKNKKYARFLGEAMQLTNFLRDVKQDLILNRIYLPLKLAKRFNLTEKDFFENKFNNNFRNFIKFFVEFNQKLYKKANKGIIFLPRYAQFPIFFASNLYHSILVNLKKNDYNVFDFNYKLKKFNIFLIFLKSFLGFIFKKYE